MKQNTKIIIGMGLSSLFGAVLLLCVQHLEANRIKHVTLSAEAPVEAQEVGIVSTTRDEILEMISDPSYWRVVSDGTRFKAQCRVNLKSENWLDLQPTVSSEEEARIIIRETKELILNTLNDPPRLDDKWREVPRFKKRGFDL